MARAQGVAGAKVGGELEKVLGLEDEGLHWTGFQSETGSD